MSSILITGSNRGIGLALVKYFLEHKDRPEIVIAACRDPQGAADLQALKKKYSGLYILQLDVLKTETFKDFAKEVEVIVGDNGLNVFLSNAGVALTNKYTTFPMMKPEDYQRIFNTNTMGPIFLVQALLPLIEKAATVNQDKPEGIKRGAILIMSSMLGSLTMNFGRSYAYRESKAALNQFARTIAVEVEPKGIVVTVLHPGHVRTDMGGPDGKLSVDESVSGLIKVIYSVDKSKHSKFIQWDGQELPW